MRKAKKSMFDVSLWKNTAEYNQYALRLYEMCLARGSWVMPDTVDTRFLETVLCRDGDGRECEDQEDDV